MSIVRILGHQREPIQPRIDGISGRAGPTWHTPPDGLGGGGMGEGGSEILVDDG
jgi:hypothetical protein